MNNKDHAILVTGGASGIGFSVAQGLLAEGWKVAIADLSTEQLQRANAEIASDRCSFVHMDVSDEAGVIQAIEKIEAEFAPLAGLVNSAGIAKDIPILETDTATVRKIMDVNLVGTFVVAREVARRMSQRKHGSIVNIASVSGIRGNLGRSAYGASKGAVINLSKVMAVELAEHGIRVNAVAPGPVETPLVKQVHTAEAREIWMRVVPMHRYASPDELTGTIAWLLDGSKSSYVTGQVISVDGGFTAAGLMAA